MTAPCWYPPCNGATEYTTGKNLPSRSTNTSGALVSFVFSTWARYLQRILGYISRLVQGRRDSSFDRTHIGHCEIGYADPSGRNECTASWKVTASSSQGKTKSGSGQLLPLVILVHPYREQGRTFRYLFVLETRQPFRCGIHKGHCDRFLHQFTGCNLRSFARAHRIPNCSS